MGWYKRSSQMWLRSNSARCDSFIAKATVRKQHVQMESNVPSSFTLRWNFVVEVIRSATAGPSRAPESQGRRSSWYISSSTLCVLYTTYAAKTAGPGRLPWTLWSWTRSPRVRLRGRPVVCWGPGRVADPGNQGGSSPDAAPDWAPALQHIGYRA